MTVTSRLFLRPPTLIAALCCVVVVGWPSDAHAVDDTCELVDPVTVGTGGTVTSQVIVDGTPGWERVSWSADPDTTVAITSVSGDVLAGPSTGSAAGVTALTFCDADDGGQS